MKHSRLGNVLISDIHHSVSEQRCDVDGMRQSALFPRKQPSILTSGISVNAENVRLKNKKHFTIHCIDIFAV